MFLRPAPIVCDLGAGNGRFAAAYAELHREWNVLAVERKLQRVRKIQRAVDLRQLTNLRVLWMGWDELLLFWSRPDSCREIHVLFPDPWPKRRHQTRRTLSGRVLAAIFRVLEPGGLFRLLTDDAGYYAAVEQAANDLPGFGRAEDSGGFPGSHFEAIFRSKGDPLYGAIWQKARANGEGEQEAG
ncbi:MAG: tRNA (guanine-N7)-methyltransferase [Methylacidiphilaceae bacterium]|nr:tRNA (guanine-N7)-methyltransferase [Candidatus Methylacidiphilaceae bacterium]